VAGPFHNDVGSDAEGEGIDDEGATEVVDVGVPEAGEAAEEEDVPDGIQVGLGFGKLELPDAGDLFLGKVDDLPLRHLQRRAEFLTHRIFGNVG